MRRLLLIAFLLLPLVAVGQDGNQISAQVDRSRLTVGERLTLEVVISGDLDGIDGLPQPRVDDHLTLLNVGRPFQQSSMSWVNGRVTRSVRVTVQFVYQAVRPGKVTIPPIVIDSSLRTSPIEIEIVEAPPPTASSPDAGWVPPQDPYLEAKVEPTEVYVGQQVDAEWRLYFMDQVVQLRPARLPTAGDFLPVEVEMVNNYDIQAREFGGEEWGEIYLGRFAYFPVKAGDLTLDPVVFLAVTRSPRFGGFFPNQREIESRAVPVKVKPLPEEGKPAGFNGAVGEFSLRLSPAQYKLEADTSFKFTVTVQGTGYPDFITKPVIKLPPGFDLYTEKVNRGRQQENGGLVAVVEYQMIIVPHQAGEYDLGPFSMPYFDPRTGTYTEARSQPIHLSVTPGSGTHSPRPPEELEGGTVTQDLRYIKPDRAELADGGSLASSPLFLGGQAVPVLAIAGALLLRRRREKLAADPALARRLRAGKKSRDLLRAAQAAARRNDVAAAYDHAGRALLAYVSDRWSLPEQGLTTGDAVAALRQAGVADATVAEVEKILAECDLARYAPGALPPGGAASLPGRVEAAMKSLAREAR